jgi:glycosyltransferase involved in cell wall biosynthesis
MSDLTPPLVSICIPTYNAVATIRETLISIVNQTYKNLDIQIVDNASTDDTLRVVSEFDDHRITIHRNDTNVGGEGNFNRCIQLATGKYTAIYHADDIYEPEMVQRQVEFLERHTEAGAVFTEANLIDEVGRHIGAIGWPKGLRLSGPLYNFQTLFKAILKDANFFICPSVMVRTTVYQLEIRTWRGDMFNSGADLDVWLRIAQRHQIGLLAKPLMRYRLSSVQFSARVRAETGKAIIFKILDHYLEQNSVKDLMTEQDWCNYARQERRDRIGRAINLFISDKPQEAWVLCYDIFSWDAIRAAFGSKRGLAILIAGSYVRLLVILRLNSFGKSTLSYMKRVTLK